MTCVRKRKHLARWTPLSIPGCVFGLFAGISRQQQHGNDKSEETRQENGCIAKPTKQIITYATSFRRCAGARDIHVAETTVCITGVSYAAPECNAQTTWVALSSGPTSLTRRWSPKEFRAVHLAPTRLQERPEGWQGWHQTAFGAPLHVTSYSLDNLPANANMRDLPSTICLYVEIGVVNVSTRRWALHTVNPGFQSVSRSLTNYPGV